MATNGFGNIKACVFDAYGTLFDIHAPVARVAARVGPDADAISRLWRQKQLEYTWLRSLMPAHADFRSVTSDALGYALEAHGVDDAGLHEELMGLYMTLDAYDDAAPALERLQGAGKITAILSNGSRDMLDAAVGSAGLAARLDHVFSVDDVGIFKPSPLVYQMVPDRLSRRPDEICFVSTNGWDAAGAANFGFRVVWLNRFGMAPERLPGKPLAVITDLGRLPEMI